MSEDHLWLVVEGRDHDRPHYDRLLRAIPSTRSIKFSIRLAEQIEVDGIVAGGKNHVLALHDHLNKIGKLTSRNSSGKSAVAFMLDRDRDDFMGLIRTSINIFYTHGSDVEADILLNSDLWAALRDAYGLDTELSNLLAKAVPNPIDALFCAWKEWFELNLVALECGEEGVAPWGAMSMVNRNYFEEVDEELVRCRREQIQESAGASTYFASQDRAAKHVADRGPRLLKGRWIAQYVKHIVAVHLQGEVVRAGVSANVVIDTAMGTVRHHGPWVEAYDAQFAEVLGSNAQ